MYSSLENTQLRIFSKILSLCWRLATERASIISPSHSAEILINLQLTILIFMMGLSLQYARCLRVSEPGHNTYLEEVCKRDSVVAPTVVRNTPQLSLSVLPKEPYRGNPRARQPGAVQHTDLSGSLTDPLQREFPGWQVISGSWNHPARDPHGALLQFHMGDLDVAPE